MQLNYSVFSMKSSIISLETTVQVLYAKEGHMR